MQINLNNQTFISHNVAPKRRPMPPALLKAQAANISQDHPQISLSETAQKELLRGHLGKARHKLQEGFGAFAGQEPKPAPRPQAPRPAGPQGPGPAGPRPQAQGPAGPRQQGPGPAGPAGPRGGQQHPPVEKTTGEPTEWYFQHGEYEHKALEGGIEVMEDDNTRVLYNSNSKTGHVFKSGENGWVLDEVRSDWTGKAASPILLDMDGNGEADVANGEWKPHADQTTDAKKIQFDLNGDGKKELTEWYGGNDGLLVNLSDDQLAAYEANGSLEISGQELYGDQGGKYKDGYDKMSQLADANQDGQLSGDELNGHYVWMDKNTDGIVDAGELQSTNEAGISSVKTTHGGDYQSSFVRNGQEQKSWDWWPTTWG